jgi:uncharacterized protein (DUF608 family)
MGTIDPAVLSLIESAASSVASWVAVSIAAALAAAIKTWWAIQRRLRSIEDELNMGADESRFDIVEKKQDTHRRYLLGDPDDPSSPGVLARMRDMDSKLDRIIEHVEREDSE